MDSTHTWLRSKGWTRGTDVRCGNRIIAQWTHPKYAGRVFRTVQAEYAQLQDDKRAELNQLPGWRYVPDQMMTLHGMARVIETTFVPVTARKDGDYPIVKDFGVLVCTCANGARRYHGFTDARINSELRMIVKLSDFHMRDEVIRKWEVCNEA